MTVTRKDLGDSGKQPRDGAGPRKVLALIAALARSGESLRLADVAAESGMSKPTAHRLLGVLAAEGWVVAQQGGRYGVGPALEAVGAEISRGRQHDSVEAVLVELQRSIGQTVHVGLRSGDRVVYTHKVEGTRQPFAMASRVGLQQPLHCTAIGKCVLSDMDHAALESLVSRTGLERRTPATLTSLAALEDELAAIRERGYALDEEENEANIRCLAAPVRTPDGRTAGAVSVSTVTFLLGREAVLELSGEVVAAARRLEGVFG